MANLHAETPLLLAFVDLSRFMAQSRKTSDAEIATTLDGFYERVGIATKSGGGRLIKVFGDGALIVFEEDAVDRGVAALLELKESIDGFMGSVGWDCRLTVKAHFGTAVAGPFGAKGDKRYDVLGKAVNTAATL